MNAKTPSRNGTATVETLTAEVRVLMVGNRQVTLSVYRQLDTYDAEAIEPFGRVRDKNDGPLTVSVVGRDSNGRLVRAHLQHEDGEPGDSDDVRAWIEENNRLLREWKALPLIVLAGLR